MKSSFGEGGYLRRNVSEEPQEAIDATVSTHERMRKLGLAVVPYEVEISASKTYLIPERVSGVTIDQGTDMDAPTYHVSLNTLAIGWHTFFAEAIVEQYPHFLRDTTHLRQYMYGTTESHPLSQPQLVDIDPFPFDLPTALEDPGSHEAMILNDELRGLKRWAEPYWEANDLEFPLPILTQSEFIKMQGEIYGY
jgi:hypothetical protein